jgi:hypothetical protein
MEKLSEAFALDIASSVGKEVLKTWMKSIEELTDSRIKERCIQVSGSLQVAVGV